MDEILILQKLDNLSSEIQALKASILNKQEECASPAPCSPCPKVEDCLSEADLKQRQDDFAYFMRNLVLNVETLNSLFSTIKGAMELKNEIEPVAKLVLPKTIDLFASLEDQIDIEETTALLRNTLGNIKHFNTAITMLKAGMELKDEIEPIAKQVLPKAIDLFSELEDQIDLEQTTALLKNTLANVRHFNTAITMLKAGMELKDEIEPIAKLSLPAIIEFFNEMEGVLNLAGTGMTALRGCKCSPAQVEAMSGVIRGIDLSKPNKIGPIGAVKKLYDPKIQEALGVVFTLLEAFGALIVAHRDNK